MIRRLHPGRAAMSDPFLDGSIYRWTLGEITTSGLANPFDGPVLSPVVLHKVSDLRPSEATSAAHTTQIERAMRDGSFFAAVRPIIVEDSNHIVDGHHRHAAALRLGIEWFPVQELYRYGAEAPQGLRAEIYRRPTRWFRHHARQESLAAYEEKQAAVAMRAAAPYRHLGFTIAGRALAEGLTFTAAQLWRDVVRVGMEKRAVRGAAAPKPSPVDRDAFFEGVRSARKQFRAQRPGRPGWAKR